MTCTPNGLLSSKCGVKPTIPCPKYGVCPMSDICSDRKVAIYWCVRTCKNCPFLSRVTNNGGNSKYPKYVLRQENRYFTYRNIKCSQECQTGTGPVLGTLLRASAHALAHCISVEEENTLVSFLYTSEHCWHQPPHHRKSA